MSPHSFILLLKAILAGPAGLREKNLIRIRENWDCERIINSYQTPQLRKMARAVFEYCRDGAIHAEFPVALEDSLYKVYGIVITEPDEIADMVRFIRDRHEFKFSPISHFYETHIVNLSAKEITVGEIIKLLVKLTNSE